MILIDTSVILDARDPNSPWHPWAVEQIAAAVSTEGGAVNPVILAEASVKAPDRAAVPASLQSWGLQLLDLPPSVAAPTAAAFAQYLDRLKSEGKVGPRTPLPDFFIGAHALVAGMTLATRDPKRILTYFPTVKLLSP